jgi:lipoyl synthase
LLYQVIDEKPEVVSHNMETIKRLYRRVRPQAKYERSLEQILKTKERGRRTKSGIMLGLGETKQEVLEAMQDLVNHGCDVLTLGQYLQPTKMHLAIERFVTPEEFNDYRDEGIKMGFKYVESGPLVRSSYHAERHLI